jgi:H+-transporting ATPase
MSLSTDNVAGSRYPNVWKVQSLTIAGILLALSFLLFATLVLLVGVNLFHLLPNDTPSLAFLTLVMGNQATIYAIREKGRFFVSLPGKWLLASSVLDISVAVGLVHYGILMAPLSDQLVGIVFLMTFCYLIILNIFKKVIFKWYSVE